MISTDVTGPVEMEFFANSKHLADVRRLVEQFARKTPLKREEVDDFLTAVDEAAANAIRHGSPQGERSRVRVICRYARSTLAVEVQDQGRGFPVPSTPTMPSPEATGGRGLPLMCALADTIEVASTPQGTRLTLRKYAKKG